MTNETDLTQVVVADDTSIVDFTFKLIVIGDIAVGKSCILQRFVNHKCCRNVAIVTFCINSS
jgi:GTPase SAR1 family protein